MTSWGMMTARMNVTGGVETFEAREEYGVPVYVTRSPLLASYVHDTVASFRDWLLQVS